jgi:large-conductance mechanosensitive channel
LLSGQTANGIKNVIKEYFTFMLALIIIPAYILFLIIQKLEEILKETKARIDHLENPKEYKTALLRFILFILNKL